MVKRTAEEIALGITGGCTRAWRALGDRWQTNVQVCGRTGAPNDARKLRKLYELCPHAVEMAYYDRKTGKTHVVQWFSCWYDDAVKNEMEYRRSQCGSPLAMYRRRAKTA